MKATHNNADELLEFYYKLSRCLPYFLDKYGKGVYTVNGPKLKELEDCDDEEIVRSMQKLYNKYMEDKRMGRIFTSESVTEGHPDKVADQISDAILDALIEQDPKSRVAAETTVATGLALIVGEITTSAYVDISKVVRDTIREIGYTNNNDGFNADSIAVLTSIDEQSADIALGVDKALESKQDGESKDYGTGAGDPRRRCPLPRPRLGRGRGDPRGHRADGGGHAPDQQHR